MKGHWIPPSPKGFIDRIAAKLGYSKTIPSGLGTDLVDAVGTLNDQIGDLGDLDTTDDSNLVAAINENHSKLTTVETVNITTESLIDGTGTVRFQRFGHVATMVIDVTPTNTNSGNVRFNYPANFEPAEAVYEQKTYKNNNIYIYFYRGSNRTVTVSRENASNLAEILTTITYVTKQ